MSIFAKSIRLPIAGLCLVSGLSLTGCAGVQVKASITCTPGKGCVTAASAQKQYNVYDSHSPVSVMKHYADVAAQKISGFFVSPAFADTLFDPASGKLNLSTINVAITNTGGTLTVSLYNGSTELAHNSFSYYRSGSSLYVSDPAALSNWLNKYGTSYDSANVTVPGITFSATTTAQTTASVKASVVYQGSTLASSSTSFAVNSPNTVTGGGKKQF